MKYKQKFAYNPLLCWDIASLAPFRRKNFYDITEFKKTHRKLKWNFEMPDIDQSDFDVIVLTDTNENILWASPGFRPMTGYSSKYAIGKKPSFLQGSNTCQETRQKIKNAIQQIIPVTTSVINYRRDGTEYHCQIEILPLMCSEGRLINFMALEKEIKY